METIKIADSKKLTAKQRRKSARLIRTECFFQQLFIPAWKISKSRLPLQHLQARVIVSGLRNFPANCTVYVDALGSGNEAENWIKWTYPDRQFYFEKKADENIRAVSAASILAKTGRDQAIDEIKKSWGEIGSGYPGDSQTQSWLKERAKREKKWPPFVRESWQTVTRLSENK